MRLTFLYTDTPDLQTLGKADIHKSNFELPDTALSLSDCKSRVLTIANLVGKLTHASLHIACKELDIKNYLVKADGPDDFHSFRSANWLHFLAIYFERDVYTRYVYKKTNVFLPIEMPGLPEWNASRHAAKKKRHKSRKRGTVLIRGYLSNDTSHKEYVDTIRALAEQCLSLLDSDRSAHPGLQAWQFMGFHPYATDEATVKKINNQLQGNTTATRGLIGSKPQADETQSVIENQQDTEAIPKTGAGRRPGAIPGKFKGITFRSQLEIRFATQLEARNIRWTYETERLGDGNYLVDFYLPDHKCWVEVKGRFELRDDYLLPQVATYLERERGEQLYIYTQTKAFAVKTNELRQFSHDEFWSIICK